MGAFEYERDDYQAHLRGLKKHGTYQEYENAIYEMNELKKDLINSLPAHPIPNVDSIQGYIDQVDGIYWGDIGFHTETLLDEFEIYFTAGAICAALNEQGESCGPYSLYYNRQIQVFMYTKVAIETNDGPDLYAEEGREFVVR